MDGSLTARSLRAAALFGLVVTTCLTGCSSSGGNDATRASTTVSPGSTTTTTTKGAGSQDDVSFPAAPPFPARGESDYPVRLQVAEVGGPAEGGDTTVPRFAPALLPAANTIVPAKNKGPIKLTGSTKPGVHQIDRTPPTKGSGQTREVYPGGATGASNPPDPNAPWSTVHNGDGSVDYYDNDGSHSHVGNDDLYTENKGEGTFDSFDESGTHTHLGPGGDYVEGPDGTREYIDDEGSVTIPPPEAVNDPLAQSGDAPNGDDGSSSGDEGPGDNSDGPGDGGPGDGIGGGRYGDGDGSGATGEPHYLTEDGMGVTTQRLGEFVLTTGVEGQEVQARTEPWLQSTTAAAVTAYAFGVDGHEVAVHVDGRVIVDSKPVPAGEALEHGLSGDGGAVGVWRDDADGPARDVVVVWPDLSVARISVHTGYLNLDLRWTNSNRDRKGILGVDDGDPSNDLTARDGTVVDNPSTDGAEPAEPQTDGFVRSWAVSDSESLFDYGAGQSTATFTRDDFPTATATVDSDKGKEACTDVPAGFAHDACVYDVGLTGDTSWVEPYETYGRRLLSDLIRRGSKADIQTRIDAWSESSGGGGTTPSRPSKGITLTAAERDGAEKVDSSDSVAAELDSETASKVFAFAVDVPSTIAAFSNDLSCPNQAYKAGSAGYAFFDADLKPLGGPRLACDDDPQAGEGPAGTYYVKLVGPGSVDVSLQVAAR